MNLFDLTGQYLQLKELSEQIEFNEETGEIIDNSDTINELFNEIGGELNDKLDSCQYVIKSLESDSNALKEEAKRLNAKAKVLSNNADRIKSMMLESLKASELQKVKSKHFNFSLRKSKSVNVINEELLGREFFRIKKEVDKTKLSKFIQEFRVGNTYIDKKGYKFEVIAIIENKVQYVGKDESSEILEMEKDKFLKEYKFFQGINIDGATLVENVSLNVR